MDIRVCARRDYILDVPNTIDIGSSCETMILGNENTDVQINGKCIVIGDSTMETRDEKMCTLEKRCEDLQKQFNDMQDRLKHMEAFFTFNDLQNK